MSQDPEFIRRLAITKYMLDRAYRESREPGPYDSLSILTLHDSIELFLVLVAEHVDVKTEKLTFTQYWSALVSKLNDQGKKLTMQAQMSRLNQARNSVKHHSVFLHPADKCSFIEMGYQFLVDNAMGIFGVRFQDLSLVDAIRYRYTREYLLASWGSIERNNWTSAVRFAGVAFEYLIREYVEDRGKDYAQFLDFGNQSSYLQVPVEESRDIQISISGLIGAIDSISKQLRIMALGIDYMRYSKFISLTPTVFVGEDGKYTYMPTIKGPRVKRTARDARFCLEFVVDTALALQQASRNEERLGDMPQTA